MTPPKRLFCIVKGFVILSEAIPQYAENSPVNCFL